MCGRYTLARPPEELVEVFDVPVLDFPLPPRYNVAPGQDALVVAEDRRGRRMGMMRWGFPSSRPGSGFVNARAESAHRTASFREAFARRRCLVPADGFYEWRTEGGRKRPWLFRPTEGGVLALGALWQEGRFAVLTVEANADVAPVHDRMPLVVAPGDFASWLGRDTPLPRLGELVRSLPAGALTSYPVSTRVNRTEHDDPGLVEPAETGGEER